MPGLTRLKSDSLEYKIPFDAFTCLYFRSIFKPSIIFIPLVSIIIFPLSLLVIIIKPLLPVYNLLTNVLETLALYLNNISFGKLIFPRLSIVIYIVYFLLIMIYLHKPKKVFIYSFLILLIIHYLIPYFNYSKYVEVLENPIPKGMGQGRNSKKQEK